MKKKIICCVLPLVSLFSNIAYAEVKLQSAKEMNAIVVNGKAEGWSFIQGTNNIILPDGENQVLFQMGQIVLEDATRKKFNSIPLLIKFESKDSNLILTYPKIRTLDQAKAFDKLPKITLKNRNGENVEFELNQLDNNGLQNFRDYEREVSDYNRTGGIASVKQVLTEPQLSNKAVFIKKDVQSSPEAKMIFLKNAFTSLSLQERQDFMSWGLKNL
ncbi:DUF2057 domain-containing protein [Photobacterium phosphoreum]|jgi:hypothetical protein|uniref:YccT family protein n=1 Tax=Photobacterium phosphoreum TaxID=659 RepID=UPI001E3CF072|nr:DUF2057 domain-containing protein [Photobacterium phosphoreum]MCD9473243.1 DUF2057 domain-containing protein [Photobacterium phosphoreum]MCF2174069.1 DUF2057 domain-containing protein [Photobacterium phosphoreum]